MRTWKIGVVGTGLIAEFHARAIDDLPNARLTGCCDTVTDKAAAFGKKHDCAVFDDVETLVRHAEVDILAIATPSGAHAEPAIAAAEAGKHVLCEKPLDVTLERIDAMIAAHEKAGTSLGGLLPYRYNDSIIELRKAIAGSRFGTITYAAVHVPWWRSEEYYDHPWHGTWELDGGGALMNQSIHMVDMLCDLMPPVESVQAFTAKIGHPQIEAEDTVAAALRYANGALGVIYGTTASFPGQFRRFEMTGTKGTVVQVEDSFSVWEFSDEAEEDRRVRERFAQITSEGAVSDPAALPYENHTRNFQAFLSALDEGRRFEIDGAEARKAVALILAVYEAARRPPALR